MAFHKRIGLDIGTSSIKVACYTERLTGPPLITCFGREFPQLTHTDSNAPDIPGTLRTLFRRHQLKGIPVAVCISSDSHMLRTLDLPFSDPDHIAQVGPYQVESLIPLPKDELAFAYAGIGNTSTLLTRFRKTGESSVLVGAIQKTVLTQHLTLLGEAGIDPVSVVPEELALLAAFAPMFYRDLNKACAVVDIGASKTLACIYKPGAPLVFRSFDLGGHDLTRLLAETQGLTLAEAERLKQSWKTPLEVGPFQPFLEKLIRELRLVFHSYEAQTQCSVTRLCITGGTAKLPGLKDLLAQTFQLKVTQAHPKPRFSSALALATPPRVHSKVPFIDYRQGVGLFGTAHSDTKRRSRWLAASLALVVILGFADAGVHYWVKSASYQTLKADLRHQFLAHFPQARVVDEIHQMTVALEEVNAQLATLGADDPSLLTTMANLSHHLTVDEPFTIRAMTLEPGFLQLDMETNSFGAMEKIKRRLSQLSPNRSISIDNARVGARPDQVVFRAMVPLGDSSEGKR